jgi:putative ABC transport system permease protein
MFLRILAQSLRVRKSRVAIAFCSILIGAAVVFAFASLYFDISIKMSRELRAYGANFFVGAAADSGATIDAGVLERALEAIPDDRLLGASPYLYGVVRLDLGNAVLAGVDFTGLKRISPFWQVEGSWIGVDFDEESCMIGWRLARNMALKAGDRVTVLRRESGFGKQLTIRGIVETGAAEDDQIFVNLSLAQKILDEPGRINHAMLSILSRDFDIDSLAAGLERDLPGVSAEPLRKISYSEGKILEKIKGLMALVAVVILVATTLCVMTTLMAMVVERTREIALHKALGAENRSVVRQFLAETCCIGVAGIAAGMVVGFALAQILGQAVFGAAIAFRPAVVPLTLTVSLMAALAAAVMPVRMAARIAPAIVLKGE